MAGLLCVLVLLVFGVCLGGSLLLVVFLLGNVLSRCAGVVCCSVGPDMPILAVEGVSVGVNGTGVGACVVVFGGIVPN